MCEDGCLPRHSLGGLKQTSLHECRSPLIETVLFKEGSGTNKSRYTELSCPLFLFSFLNCRPFASCACFQGAKSAQYCPTCFVSNPHILPSTVSWESCLLEQCSLNKQPWLGLSGHIPLSFSVMTGFYASRKRVYVSQ